MPSANPDINYELIETNEDSIILTNLFRSNDNGIWNGWTVFISGASDPHMIDSYCNWIELTWREFYYLKDLIPALNRDGLPQELNP